MWQELLVELLRYHRGKLTGALLGLLFALLVLALGFLQTIFIAVCVAIGYIIGKRVDDDEGIREIMDKLFKER